MDPQHWSFLVSETTLAFSPDCSPHESPLSVTGGSEYGEFCLVGKDIKHSRLIYHSGPTTRLQPEDIILEVQGVKVAGFTSSDLQEHILKSARNSNPVLIKTAKSGSLKKDLRPYLNYGFPKGSVDHDTQMTIRENLFQRTVPCTTRPAREGEINGVDYTFVTLEEFKALEASGNLLESGEYDGNFYGMPKPPIVSVKGKVETTTSDHRPGAHPSSKGKRQRNRSTIEATSNKNLPIDDTVHSAHIPGTDIIMPTPSRGPSRGPTEKVHIDRSITEPVPLPSPSHTPVLLGESGDDLPSNWETAYTPEGHKYYIDPIPAPDLVIDSGQVLLPEQTSTPNPISATSKHLGLLVNRSSASQGDSVHNTESTHWTYPKPSPPTEKYSASHSNLTPTQELPYGWEKVEDPHYGTYYIDHLNKKTQYDAPTKSAVDTNQELKSPSLSVKSSRSVPSYREVDSVSQQHTKPFFTKNPAELVGDRLVTHLTKSSRGFGFTIVGGDERDEEFLQIKNVVPHGPADQDGVLKTGDVLVRVNDRLVLGYTHSDVVSMFQTIKPDERVTLEVCRGYQLAFDPNDPNTEIVTTIAVSMPKLTAAEAKQREADRARNGEDDDANSLDEFADSLLRENPTDQPNSPGHRTFTSDFAQGSQMFSIEIVRGHNGFGFTIADGPSGQKVKHILDPGRCKTLQEGDLLVRIAGTEVKDMDHLNVVDVLKSCPQGKPTEIVVRRGGGRKIARPPSQSRSQEGSIGSSPSPPSTPDIDRSRRMKFISGFEALRSEEQSNISGDPFVLHRPRATSSKPGMFKWTVNGSTSQLSHSNLPSTSSFGNRDDDSEGQGTPPPLPSKSRLNSDTTADSKENILVGLPSSALTEAPSSMILPPHIRDSTNLLTSKFEEPVKSPNHFHSMEMKAPAPGTLSNKPQQQPLSQHPVMNQYNSYYQQQKESFYDIPNKYRGNNSQLTAQQRFDMFNGSSRAETSRPQEFGQPLDLGPRKYPPPLSSTASTQNYQPSDSRRSRTPGPEHMRTPPDRSTDERFRSKTPNPSDHRSRAHSLQNNLNEPPLAHPTGVTSFESSTPSASHFGIQPGWREQWLTLDISLRKGEKGFGFRIVGGPEENTQVAIGYIVPGGVADQDRRLKTGDEIIRVDNRGTLGESHHVVVALMGQAANSGHVNIGIRRRVLVQDTNVMKAPVTSTNSLTDHSFSVVVTRREHEGFGFIIVSSVNRVGAVIGRIIENSPAERCGRLQVGDRILSVNEVNITRMLHEDIVNLIKDSAYSVKLVVAPPAPGQEKRANGSLTSATALPSMANNETLVRNMHSHTALTTADRYNGAAPSLQSSKSAGNLSSNPSSQSFFTRSGSRLPSSSSGGTSTYDQSNQSPYQPLPRSDSTYAPIRPYNPPSRNGYNPPPPKGAYDSPPLPRQNNYEPPKPTYEPPKPSYEPPKPSYEPPKPSYEPPKPSYEPPKPSYEPPKPSYEPPKPSYESAQNNYNPPRPNYEPPRSTYEPPRSSGYDPSRLGVRTPMLGPAHKPAATSTGTPATPPQSSSPGTIMSVELMRSSRGFGFSIRGGREFNNMPLYVLRIAEDGAAYMDQRLLVGDEILEINDQRTTGMSHSDAINLIQSGGSKVKLLIKRTGQLPNITSDQGIPSPQGSGLSSPSIRNAASNLPPQPAQSVAYDPNSNYNNTERYSLPARQNFQGDQADNKYNISSPPVYRDDAGRVGGGVVRGASMSGRGADASRPSGFQPDRFAAGNANSRYPPAETERSQQRGYPVGRDNVQNAYAPPPHQQPPAAANKPYNNMTGKPYNTPPSSSYQPYTSGPSQYNTNTNAPSYNKPPVSSYPSTNTAAQGNAGGYQPPQPAGNYNAGAMNRQTSQPMYNYYDRNIPPVRQPPVGQNSFDNRGAVPQQNMPNSHGPRYGVPSNYKPLEYGPQGISRSSNMTYSSSPSNGGVTRPHLTYKDQPMNNYYTRQPAYQ